MNASSAVVRDGDVLASGRIAANNSVMETEETLRQRDWRAQFEASIRHYRPIVNRAVLVAGDVLAIWLASEIGRLWIAFMARGVKNAAVPSNGVFWLLGLSAIGVLWYRAHYDRRMPMWDETLQVIKVALCGAMLNGALVFFGSVWTSRGAVLLAWVSLIVLFPLARWFARKTLISAGCWTRPTIIIGVGNNAVETAKAVATERQMGLRISAFVVPPGDVSSRAFIKIADRQVPVLPYEAIESLSVAEAQKAQLIVAMNTGGLRRREWMVGMLSRERREIAVVPDFRGLPLHGLTVNHFLAEEFLMLRVNNVLAQPLARWMKRAMDIALSIAIMLLLAPLFLYLFSRIRADGGPAVFAHFRIGKGGKEFPCYKFRTMVTNSAEVLRNILETDPERRVEWERDFKLKDDPRVTRIGAFLRRTSLDELPQLWNVFLGHMSLVGPRPIVRAELERYGDHQGLYLSARPGMTGLWQVSGRSDTSYAHRVALDGRYVKNWSVWSDLIILVRTAWVVFKGQGAY
ncbi:undecaprenyl-phosphate galactose phosphotransferase WbaP [Uliginosibacterium sp. sgz301328]|uniref:undecaprenyl-phosphate galactose phosphotransferase WbaP n=1 Tax=Uliginosibacterium sp. sgz301328 TaxID=3243764 RepID=UPI00359D99D9